MISGTCKSLRMKRIGSHVYGEQGVGQCVGRGIFASAPVRRSVAVRLPFGCRSVAVQCVGRGSGARALEMGSKNRASIKSG